MRRFLLRLRHLIHSADVEDDLTREIDAHLTLLQDEYERRGMSVDEASRAARIALGGVEQAKERHRDARTFVWLNDVRQDLLHGVRLLRRSPIFAATAALSLAIGIGANTAIFTVANGLLLRAPDGIAAPAQLVDLGTARGDGGLNPVPYSTYQEISHRATTLSGTFAQQMFPRVMGLSAPSSDTVETVYGHSVSTEFFTVLGVTASVGRVFNRADGDGRSASSVAVLNHHFWITRFNQKPSVVGHVIRLNGRPLTVVGVAARGFQGTGVMTADVWIPLGLDGSPPNSVIAGGRLRPGATPQHASAELHAIADSIEAAASRQQSRVDVLPFSPAGGNRNVIAGLAVALMIIVSLVLAAACANVAGILLARSTTRRQEMALRTALGAGRGRLVRQLLTETVVLFSLGGTLGLILARALIFLIPLLPRLPFPIAVPVSLDPRIIAFTAGVSLLAAVVAGVAPAFRASKVDPATTLKEDSVSVLPRTRLRSVLVVGQIAASLLLIVMAGLFVRALRYAGLSDPDFDPRGVEIASVDLSMTGENQASGLPFWRDLIHGVRALPGVQAATLARVTPGGFEGIGLGSIAPLSPPADSEPFFPSWNIVDSGYFATLRIPLIAGRDFSDGDVIGAPSVAIVGEAIAQRFWPGKEAIGEHLAVTLMTGASPNVRETIVIGVAKDVKSSSLIDGLAGSYVYIPVRQADTALLADMTTEMTIVARRRGHQRLITELGELVRTLHPRLAIVRSESLEDALALGLSLQRLFATVSSSFGLVGLFLAAVGIYGVTAYSVARRRRELGIRMALGAERGDVMRMVLRQGMALTAIGSTIGLVLAVGASEVLAGFLYGLPPLHAPTFVATTVTIVAVGLIACYIPAHRAIGIDPARTLRCE
jgi:predicted permease